MTEQYADLHIHSCFSDSDLSLEEIFKQAAEIELKCISITDHDTVAGLKKAKTLELTHGIELLQGIEISAHRENVEIHILGYLIDPDNKTLNTILDGIKKIRKERILKMSVKLNNLGMRVDTDELFCRIKDASPTRLHLALYMVEKKYVNYAGEAFKIYLSAGKSAYVPRFRHSVKEIIKIIKDSGGVVFLAHPHILPNPFWIKDFRDWGLDGMEVIYPRYSHKMIDYYDKLADDYGLLKAGGSDSHGSYKKFTSIGRTKILYAWVEKIKAAALHSDL